MIIVKKPKIRFKGFTETWEQRKLEEICESFEYGLNAAAKEYDGENKYIRITDIDDNSHEFIQDDVTSPDIDLTNSENYQLKYGDVLFTRTGASVGKTYIYKESDGLVYYAGFLIRGRVKSNYSPEFIFQNTLTDDYDKFIRITSQRSGQLGVNAQEYASYEISVPKFEEQQKIGAYFSTLDHLITLHQCKHFTNCNKNRFAWEQRKLGSICKITMGQSPNGSTYSETPCDYILVQGNADLKDGWVVPRIWTSQITKTAKSGDLIMSVRAPAGAIGKTAYDVVIGRGVASINGNEFIYQTLKKYEIEGYWKKIATGSTFESINSEDINDTILFVPIDDSEQKQIGSLFSKLDHLITLHQSKCDNLKELKKYMLQNMFI